jgi:hypothetical protein
LNQKFANSIFPSKNSLLERKSTARIYLKKDSGNTLCCQTINCCSKLILPVSVAAKEAASKMKSRSIIGWQIRKIKPEMQNKINIFSHFTQCVSQIFIIFCFVLPSVVEDLEGSRILKFDFQTSFDEWPDGVS